MRRRRQDGGDAEAAALADGTDGDVASGEAQHEGLDGFAGADGGRGGLGEELPAAGEFGLAGAVGEEAEVADADEAVGDDMEEEAADELVHVQGHDLDAISVGVVLPAEADDALLDAEEAVVGEGDAVCAFRSNVNAQIGRT